MAALQRDAAHLARLKDVEVWAFEVNQAHVDAINAHGLRDPHLEELRDRERTVYLIDRVLSLDATAPDPRRLVEEQHEGELALRRELVHSVLGLRLHGEVELLRVERRAELVGDSDQGPLAVVEDLVQAPVPASPHLRNR